MPDDRVGAELYVRHYNLPSSHAPGRRLLAREVYKRRFRQACHLVANAIDAVGDRPLALLQAATRLLAMALADRGVDTTAQPPPRPSVEFGEECLPWHSLAGLLGPASTGLAAPPAAARLPYTIVRSTADLAAAVLLIGKPSVVAVDTEGSPQALLMQVAAADARGGVHTLMAWADDIEAYAALQALVKACRRVYVWAAESDNMAGLGQGPERNEKLVDLQAYYAPPLVRQAWGAADLPSWPVPDSPPSVVSLERAWSATLGVAMGAVAAKAVMDTPTPVSYTHLTLPTKRIV